MEQVKVTLKDGSLREVDKGITIYELAKSISGRLAKEAIVGSVDGKVVDLSYTLDNDAQVNIYKFEDPEGASAFRHTTSHMMAQAVQRLYPDTKLAIGPTIDNGFYYDFDSEHIFTPEDLEKIENEMKKIAKESLSLRRFVLPRKEALEYVYSKNEDYKVELINDLPEGEVISFYEQGEFTDLCAGCHVMNTKQIKAIKLLSIAGAYWRGDENRKMLQRIYGTSFPKAKMLEDYLAMLEEAKKRDHRKLGKELKLFTLMEEGPGFPFFLPKGMVIKNQLMDYWREIHDEAGYVEVETPLILNRQLWERSGHWDHYKENMYTVEIDEQDYAIKPMNCPGGMLVYDMDIHSYREFPLRIGEIGRVHRHELSGALHGLMRVRAFTQDDAHIFMLPDQIKDEIKNVATLIDTVYRKFGFDYKVELSTRPDDSMGSDEEWEMTEAALGGALDELGVEYVINEGDGAFYGPKIDFHLIDCLGRSWQCGTIQLDMQLPQRFDLSYIGSDGEKHRPFVIHRVAYGSIERFIGILIEHYAGKFPVWLSPVQVKIIPITDKHHDYAYELKNKMFKSGIRVEVDGRNEKIGYKIREAQLQKVPYMLVIGDKELESKNISVRSRDEGDIGTFDVDTFIADVVKSIENREDSIMKVNS